MATTHILYYLLPYKYVAVAREYTDLLTNWYSKDFSSHGGDYNQKIEFGGFLVDKNIKKYPKYSVILIKKLNN
jgi:hypothetical protein